MGTEPRAHPHHPLQSSRLIEALSESRIHVARVRGGDIEVSDYSVAAGFGSPGSVDAGQRLWPEVLRRLAQSPDPHREHRFPVKLATTSVAVQLTRGPDGWWNVVWRPMIGNWQGPPEATEAAAGASASVLLTPDGRIISADASYRALVGAPAQLAGAFWADTMPPETRPELPELLVDVASGAAVDRVLLTVDPTPRWLRIRASRATGSDDPGLQIAADIEEVAGYERRMGLGDQMTRDRLTGLFNRRALFDIIAADLPDQSPYVAVAHLDLARFKRINLVWGHGAGDACLREVSRWLQQSANHGDVVARLAGDEFVVLCTAGSAVADELGRPGDRVIEFNRQRIPLTLHAGWARREDEEALAAVSARAELAMLEAKHEPARTFVRWNSQLSDRAAAERRAEELVEQSIAGGLVTAVFQPVVDVYRRAVGSMEALARFTGPGRDVSAERIVQLSRRLGLSIQLAALVYRAAFGDLARLRTGFAELQLAVNVSRELVGTGEAIAMVADAAAECGVAMGDVVIEVTEDVADGVSETMLAKAVDQAHGQGMSVVIDDFGRGETSLALLRSLPVDGIKIDRSLLPADADSAGWTFLDGTVALLRTMTERLICEGVETVAQSRRLHSMGVTHQQGYLFGRPQAASVWAATPVTIPR